MLEDIIFFYEFACFQLPLSGSQMWREEAKKAKNSKTFQLPLSGSLLSADYLVAIGENGSFNSLSRDHDFSPAMLDIAPGSAFNSLSRDHQRRLRGEEAGCAGFQLPLSGSQDREAPLPVLRAVPAFNSLSRDHALRASRRTVAPCRTLSTPSLGITLRDASKRIVVCAGRHFQLPLSGSRAEYRSGSRSARITSFQLPLSGSLRQSMLMFDKILDFLSTPSLGITYPIRLEAFLQHRLPADLSTPSLGITYSTTRCSRGSRNSSFNSLSRDHRDHSSFLYEVPSDPTYFQLPLSGSPSPIPGFFGSPQLSAAVPLRTNDP